MDKKLVIVIIEYVKWIFRSFKEPLNIDGSLDIDVSTTEVWITTKNWHVSAIDQHLEAELQSMIWKVYLKVWELVIGFAHFIDILHSSTAVNLGAHLYDV